ncbi:hypothetical protein BDZ94DRAFT_1227626 [Collybia nuda]|uniref:Carbohydrate esterase family 16 protein n=1 Tax=Collybia nuda TaxID=64659 RepID=A0A9P5XTV0_9AGAR|nr:hypothetical protein BDZ94DRAFT_1227626 [Collybia nuda]
MRLPCFRGDSYSSDTRNNWVGYLKKTIISPEGPPVVHNFAVAGNTVEDDLEFQMQRLFEKYPTAAALENGGSALFVIWMGINDCGCTVADELAPIVEKLFDAMHDIYVRWKGRSFLLIDIPPMERSPGGLDMDISAERYDTWNAELLAQATEFSNTASKASVFVVSAHRIISDILDKPVNFGFSSDSEESEENSSEEPESGDEDEDESRLQKARKIWEDDIHISRATHQLVGDRLLRIFDQG